MTDWTPQMMEGYFTEPEDTHMCATWEQQLKASRERFARNGGLSPVYGDAIHAIVKVRGEWWALSDPPGTVPPEYGVQINVCPWCGTWLAPDGLQQLSDEDLLDEYGAARVRPEAVLAEIDRRGLRARLGPWT